MDELDSSAMEDLDADVDAGEDLNQSPCVVVRDTSATQNEEASSSVAEREEPTQSRGPAPKKTKKRTRWTEEEVSAIERQMSIFIRDLKCPGMADCLAALREEPALSRRSWTDVKFCTYNMIAKHKRRLGLV